MFKKTRQHLIWYFTRIRRLLSCFSVVNNSSSPRGIHIALFWCSISTVLTWVKVDNGMLTWFEVLHRQLKMELRPCLAAIAFLPSPNWWQPGSPSGPLSEYPTPLSCPPPLCGSPTLLVSLSHLGFRPTTALKETLLRRPTLSTAQSVSSSSLSPWRPCAGHKSTEYQELKSLASIVWNLEFYVFCYIGLSVYINCHSSPTQCTYLWHIVRHFLSWDPGKG